MCKAIKLTAPGKEEFQKERKLFFEMISQFILTHDLS
ncbi:MAG: hypothetical protein UU02_C0031G0007 [Candidatus Woesebacteria bacterium GW2011_GWA1_40_43]|uniref:Uncharacterized protein n=1 Tax=Candidatus Woesebacteria bacterium GW2011_GWA1_40_43 TaxID=1618553 RepID=A0A0G0SE21_9BACT|nr:MAG: hypothetical protein UU02_C0031G0007 [Candidatus Woesebacteria bacterium GW2011_GWA1_40_43]